MLVGKRIARLQSVLDSHTVNQIIVRRRLTDSLLAKTDVEHLPLSQAPGILSEENARRGNWNVKVRLAWTILLRIFVELNSGNSPDGKSIDTTNASDS